MYVVRWKSKNNNEGKIGGSFSIKDVAQEWVDELNKKTPSIEHWVEESD